MTTPNSQFNHPTFISHTGEQWSIGQASLDKIARDETVTSEMTNNTHTEFNYRKAQYPFSIIVKNNSPEYDLLHTAMIEQRYQQFKDEAIALDHRQAELAFKGHENQAEKVADELFALLDRYPEFNQRLGKEQREEQEAN